MSEMKLVVVGAAGRMGRTLIRVIAETPGAVLSGAIEREDGVTSEARTPRLAWGSDAASGSEAGRGAADAAGVAASEARRAVAPKKATPLITVRADIADLQVSGTSRRD